MWGGSLIRFCFVGVEGLGVRALVCFQCILHDHKGSDPDIYCGCVYIFDDR